MPNDVQIDLLNNGGPVADIMLNSMFDVNALRPYRDQGHAFITNAKGDGVIPVTNATLLKDEWIHLDKAVKQVSRERLTLVNDLKSMGLTYNLPNALGKTVIQYQNQSDINDAQVSMDGINKSPSDRPDYDITTMPVPIIHKDFYFTAREIAASRNGGMPLDTSNAELCARKVDEAIEKLHAGTYGTYTFGGGNIYGLLNFPNILTASITSWSDTAKTSTTRLNDILTLLNTLRTNYQYGPYGIYVSSNYERYLDEDYKDYYGETLRQRILKIGVDNPSTPGKIRFIKALDHLTSNRIVIVQLTSDTIQTVEGLMTTTVQWTTEGGMLYHFKVMAILLPRIRSDYNDKCGIIVATGS